MKYMKKKPWMFVVGAVVGLLLIGAVGAVAVYAQSPTPTAPANGQSGPGWPGGFGHGQHPLSQAELNAAAKALGITPDNLSSQLNSGKTLQDIATAQGVDIKVVMQAMQAVRPVHLDSAELDAAAKALGMTSTDLSTQLQSGKTLSDLATAKGVTLQSVQDAIQSAHRAEMTTQINQAVSAGQMTQDKANWLLEGLNKGYLDGPDGFGFGFGHGFGMGGPGQERGQMPSQAAPTAPTATP
ncbi:MAG TPA: hypothetical protein VF784_12315 [Anaerolineales bacterium]